MLNIRFELVAWLRGQGELHEAEKARSKFLLKCDDSPMVVKSLTRPKWNYQAPRWMFPPYMGCNYACITKAQVGYLSRIPRITLL